MGKAAFPNNMALSVLEHHFTTFVAHPALKNE